MITIWFISVLTLILAPSYVHRNVPFTHWDIKNVFEGNHHIGGDPLSCNNIIFAWSEWHSGNIFKVPHGLLPCLSPDIGYNIWKRRDSNFSNLASWEWWFQTCTRVAVVAGQRRNRARDMHGCTCGKASWDNESQSDDHKLLFQEKMAGAINSRLD